jgi:hypothetical protein
MADRFKLRLPGELTIEIDEETGDASASARAAEEEDVSGSGLLPTGYEEDIAYPRASPEVRLYDIGVRLRSVAAQSPPNFMLPLTSTEVPERVDGYVNEYVELDVSRELRAEIDTTGDRNEFTFQNSQLTDLSAWNELKDGLLAGLASDNPFNPLGYTPANGSGRRLPNVLQLPYRADFFRISAVVGSRSVNATEKAAGAESWIFAGGDRPGEAWNSGNIEDGTVFKEGKGRAKGVSRISALTVTAWGYYEGFSTTHNTKVTALPSYDSPAVEFSARLPLRIFLTPLLMAQPARIITGRKEWFIHFLPDEGHPTGSSGTYEVRGQVVNGWVAARLPIYPLAYPLVKTWEFGALMLDRIGAVYKPLAEQTEKTMLEALAVAIDRITAIRKSAVYSNVTGDASPATGEVRTSPFSEAELLANIQETFNLWIATKDADSYSETLSVTSPAPNLFSEALDRQPAGQLLGVVQSKGGKVFYVWRSVDRVRSQEGGALYYSVERLGN